MKPVCNIFAFLLGFVLIFDLLEMSYYHRICWIMQNGGDVSEIIDVPSDITYVYVCMYVFMYVCMY